MLNNSEEEMIYYIDIRIIMIIIQEKYDTTLLATVNFLLEVIFALLFTFDTHNIAISFIQFQQLILIKNFFPHLYILITN